ncbi:MAG TPA: pyruvate kinase [Flavobacteriaceae bacterium]|nr:pyruvate kinase [Flavobacteriaceae bacterium]HIP26432.1 pyruvate kinase [Flavobacteriaceae bacterium]
MNKKTKIVATLGPACDSMEMLEKLSIAGVNVFRINFSHAEYENVTKTVANIRAMNAKLGHNVAILADLQGPKLRVGNMGNGVDLKVGDTFIFTTTECQGSKERAFMTYKKFPQDVKVGEIILVDDGKMSFEVIETNGVDEVITKVLVDGVLHSKKGVNLPNTNISQPALTKKDKKDAIFAISLKVDWIALSFVRTATDLKKIKKLIKKHSDCKIPIIAKIEKPEAVKNINKIVQACDGLMVARGDLGVELPMEEVPLIQKMLVEKAKSVRIPIIIATQMMETMIESSVPTRAEVNDVANSIMDGADAVMLSGETSIGKHPIKVIDQIRRIIEKVEDSPRIIVPQKAPYIRTKRYMTKSICYHAALMANDVEAKAIQTLTNSGYTAFQISAWRPNANILAYTSNKRILSRLNLLWGVKAFYYSGGDKSTDDTVSDLEQIAKESGYLSKNDMVITLSSMPVQERGMVNTLRLTEIK